VPPPLPHVASDGARQAPAEQQPVGHETPSQVHRPATQCWPTAHDAPVPQAQLPVVEQLSALVASQVTQARPPPPHADGEGGLHVAPAQQPFGQELASQMQLPAEQR
jgi:hypothetical protein